MAELTVVKTPAATAIQMLVDNYLARCKAEGLSPRTVNDAYGYPLRGIFLPFCAREGIKEKQLNARVLDRFTSDLRDRGGKKGPLSKHSIHSYTRAINHFLSWAEKEGETTIKLKAPTGRLTKILVDALTRGQIQAMDDVAQTVRDNLMLRTLADAGLRIGELMRLRTADLRERDRQGFIHVEGARERDVPVPRLFRRLQKFAQRGRPCDVQTDRLFVSLRRRPGGIYEPLTASGIAQLVRGLAERASISKRVYPHLLRHSLATEMLLRGMNPIQLARILGHSSLTMINDVYSHLTSTDAYEAMAAALLAEDDDKRR